MPPVIEVRNAGPWSASRALALAAYAVVCAFAAIRWFRWE
jgi:hypothetical protein